MSCLGKYCPCEAQRGGIVGDMQSQRDLDRGRRAEYQGAALETLRARSKIAIKIFDWVYCRFRLVKALRTGRCNLREVNSGNEVTVSASEDTFEVNFAEVKEMILNAFYYDREV